MLLGKQFLKLLLVLIITRLGFQRSLPDYEKHQSRSLTESNSIVTYSVSVLSGLLLIDLIKKSVLMPIIAKGVWDDSAEVEETIFLEGLIE